MGDQFIAQFDLITGKFYYHSEWGKLFATLPYDVAEDIAREIWRECFTRVVLRPTEWQYCNVMKEARNKIQYSRDCLLDANHPVCHCFNKDGRMCGVSAYNLVTVEEHQDAQVMKVPNMVAGVKPARKENANWMATQVNHRHCKTRVRMCDKHKKQLEKTDSPIGRVNYVNSLITKWGWGERNGYPIRLNTNRNDIEYSGTLQRKMDNDVATEYNYKSLRWRRPSYDYEVGYSTTRYVMMEDGTRVYKFQSCRYHDTNDSGGLWIDILS